MGAYLRAARTSQKLSLERAADDTKIKPDFIMRMESDEFDFIAPAYARGFLRSYTRYLGLDEQPFLEEFDRHFGTRPIEPVQIVAADRARSKKVRDHHPLSRWTILAVGFAGILLILALIGIFAPKPGRDRNGRAPVAASASPTKDKKERSSPRPSLSPTPSPTPTLEAIFADGIELVVEATEGDCWVDVNVDGEDEFAEIVELGESETFEADDQMEVVLGAPSSIELTINGEEIGTPPTEDAGALNFTLPDDLGTTLPLIDFDGDPETVPSPFPTSTDAGAE